MPKVSPNNTFTLAGEFMTEVTLDNIPALAEDRSDKFLSFIQTLIKSIFIASWIVFSLIWLISAVLIVVLLFIT